MRDCPELGNNATPRTTSGVNRQVTTTRNLKETDGNRGDTHFSQAYEHLSTYLLPSDSDDEPAASGLSCLAQPSTDKTTTLQVHAGQPLTSILPEHGSDVRVIRVTDRGSKPQYADVQVQGVPARGVIDSGSDITIMGGELFRHVAMVARLKKS